ncbi:hypothetical protein E8E14_010679 [Neopestalotiopsis sp. 37M]|nr:hypothetical protein E8E14_010679 [Neopestalotiopsis sp. 37M]
MKSFTSILLGVIAPFAAAHSTFTTIYINDVSQGDGTCVRMNMNSENSSSPIPSLSSDDMACGSMGEKAVAFTCPATPGDKLTFEWRLWANLEEPGSIDPSHKGPCAVYAKQVADMSTTAAAGAGWFKLWEEGYDNATGKWCTEKLIDDGGLMSVQVPAALPAGNYLFRPELLALQNVPDANDPQFYTGCAQIQVQGGTEGGAATTLDVPAEYSVSIPGYVKVGEPSVTFDIYAPIFPYPMPGPNVYTVPSSSSSSSSSPSKRRREEYATTNGAVLVPSTYLIKEGNWVGVEVPDYADEDGCWAASEDCYDQAAACYDAAPPTGDDNCRVWEAKCAGIQDACSAGDFEGPPNKGQKLVDAEVRTGVVVPAVDNLGGSSGSGGSDDDDGDDADDTSADYSASPVVTAAPTAETTAAASTGFHTVTVYVTVTA